MRESLTQALELGDRLSVARGVEIVALAVVDQEPAASALLLAASHALREALHSVPYAYERDELERCLAACRAVLGAANFDSATQAGQRLRVEHMVAEALHTLSSLAAQSTSERRRPASNT